MLSRPIRAVGHVGAVVLLSGVALVIAGAAGNAAAPSRPDSYGGDATAASLELRVDKQPFPFPVTDPFHAWVPYAETSTDSSGGSEAIASSIYPGQGVLGVPALICEFANGNCSKLPGGRFPKYPDWANAQYPTNPDDSATLSQKPFPGTGPFEVTPNKVTAHADPNRVEATTITGNAGVSSVVTVQSAASHSIQQFEGATLVITAESVLNGVDIGGQLHIDQIRSTVAAKLDGSKVGAATSNTTIAGATVAGHAVTIDSTGVHLDGKGDNGLVKKTVNSALQKLAGQGIDVRSLGTSKAARPGKVVAETGGLLVVATQNVNAPGVPVLGGTENGSYTITATLGGAGVNAFASPAVPFRAVQIPPVPAAPATSGANAPPASAASSVPPPTQTGTATTVPPAQQPAVAAGAPGKPAALPLDLTNKRLKTLALVLLAYPLLVLATAPFRAPARLPGAG